MNSNSSNVPFYFREGTIFDVDPVNFTCSLYYGDPTADQVSRNVPLPNILGAGNVGIIVNLLTGTRAIAAYLHDTSKDPVAIVAILPSLSQSGPNATKKLENDSLKNKGTIPYPTNIRDGEVFISSHSNSHLHLKDNESFLLSSKDQKGLFLIPGIDKETKSLFMIANNHNLEGSGGKLSWGRIKRSFDNVGYNSFNDFYSDINREKKLRDLGFWLSSDVSLSTGKTSFRNVPLSEYKLIINEFSSEFGFTGFDNEVEKARNSSSANNRSPNLLRDREPGNSLRLSEGELIEIVGGNLVDINGYALDVNYNTVKYGFSFPKINIEKRFEEAKRKSRRGIGYHFKLSTNIDSKDISSSSKEFCMDIDKEGVLKLNIPKSSPTGNIPYVTDVNFQDGLQNRIVSSTPLNPSSPERIPIHNKDRNGNPTFSKMLDSGGIADIKTHRSTGIRFSNLTNDSYFSVLNESGKKTVRVNPTKHHNIYAAAERLIANTVTTIWVPGSFVDSKTINFGSSTIDNVIAPSELSEDYSRGSNFEVFMTGGNDDEKNKTDVRNLKYSAVQVANGMPAISTGGDTIVAGKVYSEDSDEQKLISNYFKTEVGENGLEIAPASENTITHGGVSANIKLEGSLEMSIGKDNVDSKSMILDTAGAIVMWLGKDKNNRSMIFQSDGDVLVNIGGTYPKTENASDIPIMNPGRFDLRVNVVDKGFHVVSKENKKFINGQTDKDEPYSSDYMISISSEGMVIAGMKAGAPMVIRNDGPLMLESASDKVIIKGTSVEKVTFGRPPTDDGEARSNS